jgi:FkbM family methyltransferase
MDIKTFKREITLILSNILPIRIKKGISIDLKLYGNIFYNKRNSALSFEEKLFSLLPNKKGHIIEAGGHVGSYTIFISKNCSNATLHVFEPNPQNIHFLKKNLKINSCKNVNIIESGLGSENIKAEFVSDKFVTAKGTFKTDKQTNMVISGKKLIRLEVEIKTLDDFINQQKITNVYFIKIDTEGFEPKVIRGALITIQNERPLIYFEIHGLNDTQKLKDLNEIYDTLFLLNYIIINTQKIVITKLTLNEFFSGAFLAYHQDSIWCKELVRQIF